MLIPGVEISKNRISSDKLAHFLILDIKEFIPPVELKIFLEASREGAIIACHPHHSSEMATRIRFPLVNREVRQIYDAWEIANRDDVSM
jgi:hypothetical protein